MENKYILTTDADGHYFVIPKDRQKEWNNWNESPDYGYQELPSWADSVGGSPSLVEFGEYEIK